MAQSGKVWMVSNTASGSYSASAVDRLTELFEELGLDLARHVCFPGDELPTIEDLNAGGVDILAIFTGDGTVSSCIAQLYGWGGAVLILPGGTMNLLSQRLHGELGAEEIVTRFSEGNFTRVRRYAARSRHGDALVGFSAGPATRWYQVRETMRGADIVESVTEMTDAFTHSLSDPWVRVSQPECGDPDGYPLIEIVAEESGLCVTVYNPETFGDYLQQGWFTLIREFRKGPHEVLGTFETVKVADTGASNLGLSIDGEPCEGAAEENLTMVEIDVDLIATAS